MKWVWGNGNQYFDTRVWGKGGLKSEIDISVREYIGDNCILGARRDGDTRVYLAYNWESQFRYAYGTMPGKSTINKVSPTNNVSYYMDTRYFIKSDIRDGFQSVTVAKNGGNPVELHKNSVAYSTGEIFTTNTLYLLSCNDGRTNESKYYSEALIYSTKIWDGDELLRDFMPVVATNSEGVAYAGLYDAVSERIYKQGNGARYEFNLATQVGAVTNTLRTVIERPTTRLEYVDSDELLDYVDLGIIGKDGVEMEAEMEWLRVPNDGALVGARTNKKISTAGTTGVRFFPCHYWDKSFRLGYDSDLFTINNAQVATTNTRYRILTRLDSDKGYAAFRTFANGAWGPLVERTVLSANGYDPPVDTELPMYLFAFNLDGTPRYPGKVRLFKLKLRVKQQDGTYALVRDLVPVRDPATGAPVLWDCVTKTYFRNSGTYLLAGGGVERRFNQGCIFVIR